MSFVDKVKSVFSGKTPEELYAESILKEIRQRENRTKMIAEMAGQLNQCKRAFSTDIQTSRLSALRRRQAHLSDNAEKERIRDDVIGLLAVEESEFDLNSIATAQDMERAMKRLSGILRHMYRMNRNISVTSKDLKESRNLEFDNTVEPITFSARAELVDERFVERIIHGESIEECLRAAPSGTGAFDTGAENFDFGAPGEGKTSPDDLAWLREQSGQNW